MLTPEQCRAFDQYLIHQQGVPGTILMENAGRGCAELILRQHRSTGSESLRVSILCGCGNNGGDGFVIARHLINASANVTVVLLPNDNGTPVTRKSCSTAWPRCKPISSAGMTFSAMRKLNPLSASSTTNHAIGALLSLIHI